MLTFLAIAAKKRLVVDGYLDEAVGTLARNADGKLAITRVVLRPEVGFSGNPPSGEVCRQIHEKAHRACFIANSVKTAVTIEAPTDERSGG